MITVLVVTFAVIALAHAGTGERRAEPLDLSADDGIEIAQGLALAAFGIFATIAIFAVLQAAGINLIEALFNQLMP